MAGETLSTVFGKVLQRRRRAAGMSQEALAHAAGVHRTYVGLVERGLRNPSIDVGQALAAALGTVFSDLIREAERQIRRSG